MTEFSRIAVLGPGILGGSLALAFQKRHPDSHVSLWGRNPERIAEIVATGFEHATDNLSLAIRDTELVILAVPVGALEDLGKQMLHAGVSPDSLVTDLGSVKSYPHESLGALLNRSGISFIGSHPMAGSERSGFAAADADLFEGAPCILTNENRESADDIARLTSFWKSLGAETTVMSAEEHDRIVGRISHLPHILSSLCALTALHDVTDGRFAGKGLRDTSRVAAGDPQMWLEILMENRLQISSPVRDASKILGHIADALETRDETAILSALVEAREKRHTLDQIN